MDFLGIIQWVMDVQQYPDSYKDEIDKLKTECFNLSNLIKTIGEDQIPNLYKNQIKKHLEEAENLLKTVNHKVGIVQSVLSMLSGQQTISKLKEAKDNIHNTIINLSAYMSSMMFSSNTAALQADLRVSKVKKLNSNDIVKDDRNENGHNHQTASSLQVPATLVDQLDPTQQNDSGDEGDDLFGGNSKKLNVEIVLDKNANIYELFENSTINIKQQFTIKEEPKVFFTFERITYNSLANEFKDVNRISREHADLELIEIEKDEEHGDSTTVATLQVPLSANEKAAQKLQQQSQSEHKTATKEEDQFATCVEGFSDGEGDDLFAKAPKETPAKKQKHYYVAITCKGPNGLFVYRKSENQEKSDAVQTLRKDIKQLSSGSWNKVAKGEKALLFSNDSFAILKCDKITISYTIKIN